MRKALHYLHIHGLQPDAVRFFTAWNLRSENSYYWWFFEPFAEFDDGKEPPSGTIQGQWKDKWKNKV